MKGVESQGAKIRFIRRKIENQISGQTNKVGITYKFYLPSEISGPKLSRILWLVVHNTGS